jgi:hypothetical protein
MPDLPPSMHVPPAAVPLTTHPLSYELSYEQIYNAWKKQYMADVLRPQYPKIKENSKFMVKKLKNAYTAVTQEDKDTILAEL